MVHGKNRIPYWIDRRLTGLAGPDYDATISFGLPFESEDSQYGKYRFVFIVVIFLLVTLFSVATRDSGDEFLKGALVGLIGTGITALTALGNNILEKDSSEDDRT